MSPLWTLYMVKCNRCITLENLDLGDWKAAATYNYIISFFVWPVSCTIRARQESLGTFWNVTPNRNFLSAIFRHVSKLRVTFEFWGEFLFSSLSREVTSLWLQCSLQRKHTGISVLIFGMSRYDYLNYLHAENCYNNFSANISSGLCHIFLYYGNLQGISNRKLY